MKLLGVVRSRRWKNSFFANGGRVCHLVRFVSIPYVSVVVLYSVKLQSICMVIA
jgi:hypothetical protein